MERLGLVEHHQRVQKVERKKLRLRDTDCLDDLDNGQLPLCYLTIEESATGGMWGPWKQAKSKLYLALVSVGYTDKPDGRGGSYGYGKAALIRGSKIRTVFAYTCFRERDNDPGINHRLLGMTYWGQHDIDQESFTGFARFGQTISNHINGPVTVRPHENDAATSIAKSLGLRERDPASDNDLGTAMLLVDPTVEPDDLCTAIERSWWPALEDTGIDFNISINTYDGKSLYPRPRRDKTLSTFIDAYQVATTPQDNRVNSQKRVVLKSIDGKPNPGCLGMVSKLRGWSYAEQTGESDGPEHRSLIALIRKPRMVVQYYVAGQAAPYVRGAFVADDSINNLLSRTEPKGHDAWQTNADEGDISIKDAEIVRILLRRIKRAVAGFRKDLKPPPRPQEEIRLTHFDKIMRQLLSGKGLDKPPGPTPDLRDLTINLSHKRVPINDTRLEFEGEATIAFSKNFKEPKAPVKVRIRYQFMEDERAGDTAEIDVEAPSGFHSIDDSADSFEGTLEQGQEAVFKFLTEPYDHTWTGRLVVDADIE